MNLRKILEEATNYAIVGMKPNTESFAHKIDTLLKLRGKTTFAVNPNYKDIDGKPSYASVGIIKEPIDIVVMVVNPLVGLTMLEDIAAKGVQTLWLQPGTRSQDITDKATHLGLQVIEDCVLVQYE